MSFFGGPPGQKLSRPTPPEKGSFPLDHDGECKPLISGYLSCIKKAKGTNEDACRQLAKAYLSCRMEHNLMARDEMKNLGFGAEQTSDDGAKESEGANEDDSKGKDPIV